VLHVVESFASGVADAVVSFARASPRFEHHLLFARRPGADVATAMLDEFASGTPLEEGHISRLSQITRVARTVDPSIVHAHSSFAGFYARVALARASTPIVYSPHCFAFERGDLTPLSRRAYRLAERVLARNTDVFAVCSPREAELVRELSKSSTVVHVPNIASVRGHSTKVSRPNVIVAGVGRVVRQKGTDAFAAIAQRARQQGLPVQFLWIGGGDQDLELNLRTAGVEVSGWVSKQQAMEHLARADIYVHTAEWEGFPIGLLEAAALGVPTLVHRRPYTIGLPEEIIFDDDIQLVSRLSTLLEDARARDDLLEMARQAFSSNSASKQSEQLAVAYRAATERRKV
jgi:glycosyltransferase involved in cell wall biosynthesis